MPRWPIHLSVGLPCPAIVYAHYVDPTTLMRSLAEAKLIRQTRPRRTEQGDYEIRSVPSMLGEHSMSGGVMPKVGFKEDYEKADPSL